jgi:hypothetical protein
VSDFPTIVYKTPGPHAGPPGKTYASKGVKTAAELAEALKAGWHRTLPEACGLKAPEAPAPPDEQPKPAVLPPRSAPDAEPLRGPFTSSPKHVPPPNKAR